MILSGDTVAVAAAYVAACSEITNTVKNDARGVYNNYPTLRKVMDHVTPIFIEHQLKLSQEPIGTADSVGVATSILHSSGGLIQFEPFYMPVADKKPQTCGSALSYAKRYALMSILGLVSTDEDDDAQAAQDVANRKPGRPSAPPTGTRPTNGKPPSNGGNGAGIDNPWEEGEPSRVPVNGKAPVDRDKISPDMLKRLKKLMVDYYGKQAAAEESSKAMGASKKRADGSVRTFAELQVNEAQVLIAGLEKRIAESVGQESQLA